MKHGIMTTEEFAKGGRSLKDRLEAQSPPKDESSLIASMVARRLDLPDKHRPKGQSGCPLIDLCLESPQGLSGAILVYRKIPRKAASLLDLMIGTGGKSLEETFLEKRTRSRHPRKILEDEFLEARDTAGAWISKHRLQDVAMVFREGTGVLMVYSGEMTGRLKGISKPSRNPVVALWVHDPQAGPTPRRLSTLDAFLAKG